MIPGSKKGMYDMQSNPCIIEVKISSDVVWMGFFDVHKTE